MAKIQAQRNLEVVQPIPDSPLQFIRRGSDNAMIPLDPDNKDCRKAFQWNKANANSLRLDLVTVLERQPGDRDSKLEMPDK